ncbi:Nitric oxide reductase activation protein NorD [hydrothermal vent metagenome]|uniref:Nitric oxide reductase activation protein NorD n=1 Tax=hydrothermal vent metagenome TaxID=652676 RepID=A0A3B0X1R2_9ZZZZ
MEEHIGKIWDRFLKKQVNKAYKEKQVLFTDKRKALTVFYHLLGGDKGKELQITDKRSIKTSRSVLEKISGSGNTFFLAWQDDKGVYLPESLAYFDDKSLNEMHYFWLVALAANLPVYGKDFAQNNLQFSQKLVQTYPGFQRFYQTAITHFIKERLTLSIVEEDKQRHELAFINSLVHRALINEPSYTITDIYPFPLWLYPAQNMNLSLSEWEDDYTLENAEKNTEKTDELKMKKRASKMDDDKKSDGLLVFLPDSLMSIMEQINVDRSEDDSFDEDALYNAEDLDEITLGKKRANLSARIKMDLDSAVNDAEEYPLGKGHFIDEWDYKKQDYLKGYVCIKPIVDIHITPIALPKRLQKLVKKIASELDLMQLDRLKNNGLPYGDEINMDAWIDYLGHQNKSLHPQRFYESVERKTRDLSTLILADVSLSTEAGITQEIRIIDMIKDGLMVFSESLNRLEDPFALYTFSSLKNTNVRFQIIKNFKESYSDLIRGRIDHIKPGYYTRLGAAIRESAKILDKQKTANKLLLIISDGKPNDVDRYDGRYGIEDTKKAIEEVKKMGITPFCVTIDLEAKDYLSYLFGRNGYVVIRDSKKLPKVLPEIYMNLTL